MVRTVSLQQQGPGLDSWGFSVWNFVLNEITSWSSNNPITAWLMSLVSAGEDTQGVIVHFSRTRQNWCHKSTWVCLTLQTNLQPLPDCSARAYLCMKATLWLWHTDILMNETFPLSPSLIQCLCPPSPHLLSSYFQLPSVCLPTDPKAAWQKRRGRKKA